MTNIGFTAGGFIHVGRVPSSQSAMQMGDHNSNGDMPPFDLVSYGREVGGNGHPFSSRESSLHYHRIPFVTPELAVSGQPIPDFTMLSGATHASIPVQDQGMQVHGVLHQQQVPPFPMTNKELPLQMPM
jgi:hypothetical protein